MKLPWRKRADDPYWDAFINRPPADPNNLIPHSFKQVQAGGVNPVKTEIHSPNVMSQHVIDLAKFYGADQIGIVALEDNQFGIVCGLDSEYDTRTARGIGGQTPAMKGLFATFTLAAFIRELGYEATLVDRPDAAQLAAGLGMAASPRRFLHVADVILTDLPLDPRSA
jgi:hypothetical protein